MNKQHTSFSVALKATAFAALFCGSSALAAIPSAGAPVGVEFRATGITILNQSDPGVASDAAGESVVVWDGNGFDTNNNLKNGIFAQRYDANGQMVGPEIIVDITADSSTDQPLSPRVAMDAVGDFVVVWTFQHVDDSAHPSTSTREFNAEAALYDKTGTPIRAKFQVNLTQAGDKNTALSFLPRPNPAVGMDAAGDFVVAWTNSVATDGSGAGVYAQRYNSTGTVLTSADILVNVTTTGDQSTPVVAMSAAGAYAIAWAASDAGNGVTPDQGIFAQLYAANGTVTKTQFQVNTHNSGNQFAPAMAMDATGDFVVAWDSTGQDGSGQGIYAQRYSSGGTAAGAEFQVNTTLLGVQTSATANDQVTPAIAMAAQGDFAIFWASSGTGSGDDASGTSGVFGQSYLANGTVKNGRVVNTTTANTQDRPAAAMDAAGDLFVTWESIITGGEGIFAQRYERLGSVDLSANIGAVPSTVVKPGDSITLTASIKNNEAVATPTGIPAIDGQLKTASGLQSIITLPAGTVFGSSSGSNWTCPATPSGNLLSCTYAGSLAAGVTSAALTVAVEASNNGGVQAFSNDVSGNQPDATPTNNDASTGVVIDHPPVANDSALAVAGNSSNDPGSVTATDVDGDSLAYSVVASPAHGSAVLNPNGNYTYTPNAGFGGHDTFTFKANDGSFDSNNGTVTLRVNNQAPVTSDGVLTVAGNTTGDPGTLVATDADGDTLTFLKVSGPANGSVTVNSNGSYTYSPSNGFVGADSFTFKANDGIADSNVSTVSITVNHPNHAPVASAGTLTVNEDSSNDAGTAAATDSDGDAMTFSLVTGAAHGSVVVNADGSYKYTPAALYFGADSFSFKANDGSVDSNVATVAITVTHVNHVPVANGGVLTVNEDGAGSSNLTASDADTGDTLTYTKVSGPAHGILSINSANGNYSYTPNSLYFGADSFTFKVNDGTADSAPATVSITVNHVNHAPVANTGLLNVNQDSSNDAGVLSASDVDIGDTLTYSKVSSPSHGTATVAANGSYSYTPVAGYVGVDSFTFKANDGTADSNVGTVAISVNHLNHAPVASSGTLTVSGDSSNDAGTLVASDADGDALTFSVVSTPTHGAVTVNTNGSYTYTPTAGFSGSDSFTFKANDGTADSNVATVAITVSHVDQAPVAAAAKLAVNRNTAKAGTVTATDADSASLVFSVVQTAGHGTVTLQSNGSFSYKPAAGFSGADSFSFKANDGTLDSNVAAITITVTEHAPVGTAQSFSMTRNTTHKGTLKETDADTGDKHTFSTATAPKHGKLVITASTGAFSYTPSKNFTGKDSFVFKVSDGAKSDAATTVSITVK